MIYTPLLILIINRRGNEYQVLLEKKENILIIFLSLMPKNFEKKEQS